MSGYYPLYRAPPPIFYGPPQYPPFFIRRGMIRRGGNGIRPEYGIPFINRAKGGSGRNSDVHVTYCGLLTSCTGSDVCLGTDDKPTHFSGHCGPKPGGAENPRYYYYYPSIPYGRR